MKSDKIVCVGKNYLEHAKELGDQVPEKPVLFLKPFSVLKQALHADEMIYATLPKDSGSVHHECEIVLKLRSGGSHLSLEAAKKAIGAVTVGLDMTLRDRQAILKKNGHPWTVSKVFPDAAIAGPWISIAEFPNFESAPFSLKVNGALRQKGHATEMMLSPAECLVYISEHFPLCEGDLIYTGTPAGVNAVVAGQTAVLDFGQVHYSVKWS